jgi:hypothetical protein
MKNREKHVQQLYQRLQLPTRWKRYSSIAFLTFELYDFCKELLNSKSDPEAILVILRYFNATNN